MRNGRNKTSKSSEGDMKAPETDFTLTPCVFLLRSEMQIVWPGRSEPTMKEERGRERTPQPPEWDRCGDAAMTHNLPLCTRTRKCHVVLCSFLISKKFTGNYGKKFIRDSFRTGGYALNT